MENDIYSLLGYGQAPAAKKSSTSIRVDNLLDRGIGCSAKINSLKRKQKARELKEMKSVPTINEKSRRLAENMKRERLDLIASYETKQSQPAPEVYIQPEPVRISVNIMRQLEMTEPAPAEPDLKSMNIHQRTKYWKEQKEKKLEDQRKAKKDKELDGCTFKPTKVEIQEFEISQKPGIENKNNRRASAGVKGLTEEQPRKMKSDVKGSKDAEDKSLAFLLKGVADDKPKEQPLRPSSQTVQVKPGFLSQLSKPIRNK